MIPFLSSSGGGPHDKKIEVALMTSISNEVGGADGAVIPGIINNVNCIDHIR